MPTLWEEKSEERFVNCNEKRNKQAAQGEEKVVAAENCNEKRKRNKQAAQGEEKVVAAENCNEKRKRNKQSCIGRRESSGS